MKTCPKPLYDALLIVLQERGGRKRELKKIKPWGEHDFSFDTSKRTKTSQGKKKYRREKSSIIIIRLVISFIELFHSTV